jgi:acyl-CoA thioester hydrolase
MNVFSYKRQVHFAETDAAGVVHFTHLLQYAEEAEHALMRSIGFPVWGESEGHILRWPRVGCSSSFHHPAQFGDELRIDIAVKKLGHSSLILSWWIFLEESVLLLAEGETKTVACLQDGPKLRSTGIPEPLRTALADFSLA